jgi:hypothetical protein
MRGVLILTTFLIVSAYANSQTYKSGFCNIVSEGVDNGNIKMSTTIEVSFEDSLIRVIDEKTKKPATYPITLIGKPEKTGSEWIFKSINEGSFGESVEYTFTCRIVPQGEMFNFTYSRIILLEGAKFQIFYFCK